MARLHTTPASTPDGYDSPLFGFPVTTYCGETSQSNGYKHRWADFYAKNRLMDILKRAENTNGKDTEFRDLVEHTAQRVVPRLLGDGYLGGANGIVPVVVHGDLWSGNQSRGRIAGLDCVEEMVFDPRACYTHSEYELGIIKMFGGFGGSFLSEYHKLNPKTEPVGEYADRIQLYESYYHLNHNAIFGDSYKLGATSIMKALCSRYGA